MFLNNFKKKKAEEASPVPKEEINLHSIAESLCDLLKSEMAVLEKDDSVYIPAYDLKIYIEPKQLEEHMAVLYFTLECPQWDRKLYECCTSLGPDTQQAIGLALGNFSLGLLSGVFAMLNKAKGDYVKTDFQGKKHGWKVYKSNAVVMSNDSKKEADLPDYWDMLKTQLSDYLGDGKIAYIKIYGASVNHEITGECRVNDIKIEKLSEQVSDIVKNLNVSGVHTQKQFFIFMQDDETCNPYPYTQEQITEKVRTALSVFEELLPEEDGYDRCEEELVRRLEDPHLATEIFSFLPELCAGWQFPSLKPTETLNISFDNEMHQYSMPQITIYHMLAIALEQLICNREISNELFINMVCISALWNVICSAKEDGKDITKEESVINTIYSFADGYIAR